VILLRTKHRHVALKNHFTQLQVLHCLWSYQQQHQSTGNGSMGINFVIFIRERRQAQTPKQFNPCKIQTEEKFKKIQKFKSKFFDKIKNCKMMGSHEK
jgi:hypothetical protein